MNKRLAIIAAVSVVIGAGAATAVVMTKKDERASTTTTTSAAVKTTSSTTDTGAIRHATAAARISGRRCDREDVCDPFGEGKRHPSRPDCDVAEYARTKAELPEASCRDGIDDAKLRACMDAIAQQECTTLADSLETLDACTPATLCTRP